MTLRPEDPITPKARYPSHENSADDIQAKVGVSRGFEQIITRARLPTTSIETGTYLSTKLGRGGQLGQKGRSFNRLRTLAVSWIMGELVDRKKDLVEFLHVSVWEELEPPCQRDIGHAEHRGGEESGWDSGSLGCFGASDALVLHELPAIMETRVWNHKALDSTHIYHSCILGEDRGNASEMWRENRKKPKWYRRVVGREECIRYADALVSSEFSDRMEWVQVPYSPSQQDDYRE
ncbi:hypothetical protein K438DRAFT_1759248 [Mycena galopus ATCC 62051]|nr:hypothetical protein K438DRAFT_1759248 [Mycena galopus ATCC 62051]